MATTDRVADEQADGGPLAGTRAQSIHRLQVGVSLLVGIVLIVGLANVIEERAKQSEQAAVPEAAATVMASPSASANDPLADAGVVPDLPAEGEESVGPDPAGETTTGRVDDGT